MSRIKFQPQKIGKRILLILLIAVFIFGGSFAYNVSKASAALITSSSILPTNSIPSATGVTYATTFTFPDTTGIECIQANFATTSGLGTPATGMTSGASFTLTGGGLTQANWTNYGSTNGTLEIYSGTARTPTTTAVTINWAGVTNTSITNPTPIYAQISTYTSDGTAGAGCTGLLDQSNVMALLFTSGVVTTVSVDPTLTFSVANDGSAVNSSGDTVGATTTSTAIPFGTVDAGAYGAGSQTLTVSSNASHGYDLYVNKTQLLTDTNADTYADQTTTFGSPGAFSGSTSQSAFGVTDDSTNDSMGTGNWAAIPTQPSNAGLLDSATGPVNSQVVHAEYKVFTSNTQAPGTYTTTVVYTATPTY